MFRAAQNPIFQRVVTLVLSVYLLSVLTPAFGQAVSPSGYRYDTPYGDPYHPSTSNDPNSPYYPNRGYIPRRISGPGYSPSYPRGQNDFDRGSNPSYPRSTPPMVVDGDGNQWRIPGYSSASSSANPANQSPSGYSGRTSFVRLGPGEMHAKTVWSAADAQDQEVLDKIRGRQIAEGPWNPSTLRNMLEAANYFIQEQKLNLAEQELKEIIASIQTFGVTPENSMILSVAQGQLAQLVAMDARVAATPVIDPNTLYVSRPSYYTGPGSCYGSSGYSSGYGYGYGGGGWGYGGRGYSHYHSPHVHFGSFHSSGGSVHFGKRR